MISWHQPARTAKLIALMGERRLGLNGTSHRTEMRPSSGTQNTVSHGEVADAEQRWQRGTDEWTQGSISPQRQEGCTTKAVGTGTEKGH